MKVAKALYLGAHASASICNTHYTITRLLFTQVRNFDHNQGGSILDGLCLAVDEKIQTYCFVKAGLTKDVTPIHRTKKFQLKLAFEHTTVDFLIQVPITTFFFFFLHSLSYRYTEQ